MVYQGKFVHIVILVLFCVLLVGVNLYYVYTDRFPPTHDEAMHLLMTYHYYQLAKDGDIKKFLVPRDYFYPPLIHETTAFLYFLRKNPSIKFIRSTMNIYLVLLIFSLYGIGRLLFDENTGVLCAILSATFPFITFFSHKYMLDLPLASMVTMAVYMLLKSEKFTHSLYTIAFFVVCGVGLLIKWSFPIYIALPFIYALGCKIFLMKEKGKRWILIGGILSVFALAPVVLYLYRNLYFFPSKYYVATILTFIVCVAIILSILKDKDTKVMVFGASLMFLMVWGYYGVNIEFIPKIWSYAETGNVINAKQTFLDFVKYFVLYYQGVIVSLLLLIGLVYYLAWYRDRKWDGVVLLVNFIFMLVIMRMYTGVEERYFLPLIPFSIPFAAFWVFRVKLVPFKFSVIVLILLSIFVNIGGWFFNILDLFHIQPKGKFLFVTFTYAFVSPPPDRRDWKVEEMAKYISYLSKGKKCYLLYVYPNIPQLSANYLQYEIKLNDIDCRYVRFNLGELSSSLLRGDRKENMKESLMELQEGEPQFSDQKGLLFVYISSPYFDTKYIMDILKFLYGDTKKWDSLKTIPLPDNRKAYIFYWKNFDTSLNEKR